MKNIKISRLFFIVAVSVAVTSCNKSSKYGNTSRGTGWKINDKEGGFQYNTKFKEQETAPGLVFVEGGTFTMGKVQDDVMHDWNNSPNQQHVQSFYMDETEVTNVMYLEYLDWVKRVYPPTDPKFTAIYNGALPDTLVWRNRLGYSEILVENYLRHPAYGNFPVVGVSWLQANEYAKWRSDRVAEMGLQKEGYLEKGSHIPGDLVTATSNFNIDTYVNAPKETYKDSLGVHLGGRGKRSNDSVVSYATRETGAILIKYRLPTEAEWEYASRSEINKKNIDDYAWYRDNSGGKYQKVGQKEPNKWGIYDMLGNVSEWVADSYEENIFKSRKLRSDPFIFNKNKYPKVYRGGSWNDDPDELLSNKRFYSNSRLQERDPQIPKSKWWNTDAPHIGFRVVRVENTDSKSLRDMFWNN